MSSAAALVEEFHVDGLRVDLTQAIHRDNVLHADNRRGLGNANVFGQKMLREWSRTLRLIKPSVMLTILRTHAAGAKRVFYFDVDLVVRAPWRFFRDWVSCGIAVCRDVNEPYMSENHPLRKRWRDMAG